MWWREGWWVDRRCSECSVGGGRWGKSSGVEIPRNKRTRCNTVSWMKERETKAYKVKGGTEASKGIQRRAWAERGWVLEASLSFLRNASTEDFVPKGLKYAHYWITGQFVHPDLLLLKRTVCPPLTSAETSPRELGQKPASPNAVSYHRFLSQSYWETWTFPLWKMGFIPSGQKAQGILPPESYHRRGLQPSLSRLRSSLTDRLPGSTLGVSDSIGWGGESNIFFWSPPKWFCHKANFDSGDKYALYR